MSNSFAFGSASEIDIQNSLCGYSTPANGNWFISLATPSVGNSDQVSLKLSSILVSGNRYLFSFYQKADITYTPVDTLFIGISSDRTTFGTQIYSIQPQPLIGWTFTTFTFSAPITGQFITFGNKGLSCGWNYIDDIQINIPTGIVENYHDQSINIFPNPFFIETNLRTTHVLKDAIVTLYNSLGQEIKQVKNISGESFALQRDNLPSGLYFIRLTQDNIILTTEKLIINDN